MITDGRKCALCRSPTHFAHTKRAYQENCSGLNWEETLSEDQRLLSARFQYLQHALRDYLKKITQSFNTKRLIKYPLPASILNHSFKYRVRHFDPQMDINVHWVAESAPDAFIYGQVFGLGTTRHKAIMAMLESIREGIEMTTGDKLSGGN